MKKLLLVCVLAACGGGQKSNAVEPAPGGSPPAAAGIECAKEIALQCAAGVDGCSSGKTTVHVCVPADEVEDRSCELEFIKQCPDGQIDACLQQPPSAKNHICVYK